MPQINIPTFIGMQLGPMTSHVDGVGGRCGCFYYWDQEVAHGLNRAHLDGLTFTKVANKKLAELCEPRAGGVWDVVGTGARNTLDRRRIAYDALKAGLTAVGIDVSEIESNDKVSSVWIDAPKPEEK